MGSLAHAMFSMRNNHRVVLTAVINDPKSLQYAGIECRRDRMIAVAAVKQNSEAMQFVDPEIRPLVRKALADPRPWHECLYVDDLGEDGALAGGSGAGGAA